MFEKYYFDWERVIMESFIGKEVRGVDFTGIWRQGTVISEK